MTPRLCLLLACGAALAGCSLARFRADRSRLARRWWRGRRRGGHPRLPGPARRAPPLAPVPTPAQVAFQRAELTADLHFGLNTFDGTEYGNAAIDTPSLFNPTALDARQWVTALKEAGFRQAKLIVKHTTGFCLWPSAYTDYSVKNSPWKNGQGDVVQEFTDAMHAAGMRVAFFLSPSDAHYPSSSPGYETYFRNQLTELLTNYGPVSLIEFNGFQAPTGLDWAGIVHLPIGCSPMCWWTWGQRLLPPERTCDGSAMRRRKRRVRRLPPGTSRMEDRPMSGIPPNRPCPTEGSILGSGTRTTPSSRWPVCSRSISRRSA